MTGQLSNPPGEDFEAAVHRAKEIRRRVRRESGRSDGRCGKVSEAIERELGWSYRWGHLRLLDGICWIHCWNQHREGAILDATADQFEERWPGDVILLPPGNSNISRYSSSPPGHVFQAVINAERLLLCVSEVLEDFESPKRPIADAPPTDVGWSQLGSAAVELHSGWQLPEWIGREAGALLRHAATTGQPLPSRTMEFALDAADRQRRLATYGEWMSPEWRVRRL